MPTQDRVGQVFVELADSLVADFDTVEFLTTLALRTAELLHASEAGVILADETGSLRSVASSSETARSTEEAALTHGEIDLARALADVATIALLQERGLREARMLNEQLQAALHSRVVIEQAKGVLAERRQVDMDVAFELLRHHARSSQRKLGEVAAGILDGTIGADDLGLPG